MTKACIIDSSSAILLYKGGILGELMDLYMAICPPSVINELTRNPLYPGAEFFLTCCARKRIAVIYPEQIKLQGVEKLRPGLGAGEAECMALYFKKAGDFIILDDKKGALFCRKEKIPYINALLVPKILFLSGFLPEKKCDIIFSQLVKEGRYSDEIIQYASDVHIDDLFRFLPVKD